MRVSIITAYYKNEAMTEDWLDNIKDKVGNDDEIIVVNAGSSPIGIHKYELPIVRQDLVKNESFSNSMNAGLKLAEGDYVCIIGNDTFPVEKDWLDRLIAKQQETGAAIVAPVPDNPPLETYDRLKLQDGSYFMFPAICWLMPKSTIKNVGLFDEKYKVGTYEDNDFCDRVRNLGGKIIVDDRTHVHHLLSQTMKFFNIREVMHKNHKIYQGETDD